MGNEKGRRCHPLPPPAATAPQATGAAVEGDEVWEVFLFLRGLGGVTSGLFVFERGRSVFVVVVFFYFLFFLEKIIISYPVVYF